MTLLKELRLRTGITAEEMAFRTNIPLGSYNAYEQGRHQLRLDRAQLIVEQLAIFLPHSSEILLNKLALATKSTMKEAA